MTDHVTGVVVRGPTGHEARCRCGWALRCVDAIAAARACWDHARDATGPIPEAT